ncbi:MAG: nucleotidyltransferase domain-containing protein, partial [Chloroflexi bacterium]|nr:nucleotidyltransferase domain-containing protein [Chloroflexota bacterium]
MHTIRELVRHIVREFDPDEIILFGSHAYGKAEAWSDVDLLVVKDIPEGEEMRTADEIHKTLPPHWFGIDILVRSREVIDRRRGQGDWFLREIVR